MTPYLDLKTPGFEEGLDELVSKTWRNNGSKKSSIENGQCKLRSLRHVMKGWNRNRNAWYRELKKYILIKLDNIDKKCETYGLNVEDKEEQLDLRAQLDRLLGHEEAKWKQRAKVDELIGGQQH